MIGALRAAPLLHRRARPPAARRGRPSPTPWCACPGSPPTSAPRLVDLEVNPLIVRRAGGGAVAVDGRATLNPKEEESRP